jgi:hypothetical protein
LPTPGIKYSHLFWTIVYSTQMIYVHRCDVTAICSVDFIHRLYVLQPQRFEGCLFLLHQVNLLRWVRSIELASIGGKFYNTVVKNI